jgi:hypothetical protein
VEEPARCWTWEENVVGVERELPANIDRGVSLQIIASDRKKKNDLRNWAFPQPVDAQSVRRWSSH